MVKWISILRGINVGGKRVIKMSDLVSLYFKLGFTDVVTFIQSGNVTFFSTNTESIEIKAKIENGILNEFGFEVMSIVFEEDYLKEVISNNPFKNENTKMLYFSFLDKEPSNELIEKFNADFTSNTEVSIGEKVVYVFCENGYSKTKFNNNFLEKRLEVNSTTRNFNTLMKLL
ncbi:MAG: DUF1697 domain-containing protein [Flavobacteriales bacterium]|nr:DUF1697 domain-containing protein [Flavobacteriales bacterium]